jgi:hypothetical protein
MEFDRERRGRRAFLADELVFARAELYRDMACSRKCSTVTLDAEGEEVELKNWRIAGGP